MNILQIVQDNNLTFLNDHIEWFRNDFPMCHELIIYSIKYDKHDIFDWSVKKRE